MFVKKNKRKVYGAQFSKTEEVALKEEIRRQFAEYDAQHAADMDACILYVLHEEFGFGEKRLKRFYKKFSECTDELIKHYEMPGEDRVWLCTKMLHDAGIYFEEWDEI